MVPDSDPGMSRFHDVKSGIHCPGDAPVPVCGPGHGGGGAGAGRGAVLAGVQAPARALHHGPRTHRAQGKPGDDPGLQVSSVAAGDLTNIAHCRLSTHANLGHLDTWDQILDMGCANLALIQVNMETYYDNIK